MPVIDINSHKAKEKMDRAIKETERRRCLQTEFNEKHGIVPKTIKKSVRNVIEATTKPDESPETREEADELILRLREEMLRASRELRFEDAAKLRDKITLLERGM